MTRRKCGNQILVYRALSRFWPKPVHAFDPEFLAALDLTNRQMSAALTALKAKGFVHKVSHGMWRITG